MSEQNEMQRLRKQIAQTVARRDALKLAIEQGRVAPSRGLRELGVIDAQLSSLDTRFKTLWDKAQSR